MTKLKSAESLIFQDLSIDESDMNFFKNYGKLSFQDAVRIINRAKRNAIEATLEVAAREGKVRREQNGDDGDYFEISPLSITSLINHPNLNP